MSEENTKLRIDKWLWFARVAKTRSLAAKLVVAGNVRVNKEKASAASRSVKPGDVLTIAKDNHVRILEIVALGTRRGPAPEAQLLYKDLTPPPEKTDEPVQVGIIHEAHKGRPTKKDRRQLMRLKQDPLDEL
ncbi:RNA-binding S4 domain-containing protein [Cohaesibacter haloalkalitolerans]|uniref:RNA-binding S4 domain-containing protein n=1 Tax=Cohaesibacter haloalkalitolerans TaxID=1162980 RepID=UPI000E654445|nr:RNA-binding S4 domain-containing protein [Cohaesibacter haloalkalitolerans]